MLVRPVLLYYPVVMIAFFLSVSWRQRLAIKSIGLHGAAIVLIFSAIIGTQMFNNLEEHGHFAYTSQTGTHALFWVYPQANEFAKGTPRDDSVFEMRTRYGEYQKQHSINIDATNPYERSAFKQDVASIALWELGVWNLAKAWTSGAIINVFAPAAINAPPVRNMDRPSFSETKGKNPLEKIRNYLNDNITFSLVIIPALSLTLIARVLLGVGLFKSWIPDSNTFPMPDAKKPEISRVQILHLIFVCTYFAILTGPIVGAKYRLPLEPVIDVFTATGVLWCIGRWNLYRSNCQRNIIRE